MRSKVKVLLMLFGLLMGHVPAYAETQWRTENHQGVSYEVPSDWEKVEKGKVTYYYPKNGVLMVASEEGDFSVSNDSDRKALVDGISSSFKLSDEKLVKVGDREGYMYTMDMGKDSGYESGVATLFDSENGIVAFMVGMKDESDIILIASFSKILDSVSKATDTKESSSGWNPENRTFTGTDGILVIDKVELTEDISGDPAAKIYFTLTNTSNKEQSALLLIGFMAEFQQRNQNTSNNLRYTILDLGGESDHLNDNLVPGGTISGFYPVKLENTTDPLVIKFLKSFKTVAEHEIVFQ